MNDFPDPTAWALLLLVVSAIALIAITVLDRRRKTEIHLREIRAFTDLRDQLKQAAESGRPLHIALGGGGLGTPDTVSSLAALQVLEGLIDAAVSYDVAPFVTVGDPTLLPLAQDVVRRGYERNDVPDFYDPCLVRFVAPSALAYSAGAVPVGVPEDVSANVVVGVFGAEASLIADISDRHGTPKAAAVDRAQAIGALYPATDRLAVGEELYAAGAQVTGKKGLATSLMVEDVLRYVLALFILMAAAIVLITG